MIKEEKNKKIVIDERPEIEFHYNFAKDFIGVRTKKVGRARPHTKESIRTYLNDPIKNYSKLQSVDDYLTNTSGTYMRMKRYLANLFKMDYLISPTHNRKPKKNKTIRDEYFDIAKKVKKYNIKYNIPNILYELFSKGEIFLYKKEDIKGLVFVQIPNTICEMVEYENGVFRYIIDLSKIQKNDIIAYPTEIQNAFLSNPKQKYKVSNKGFAFNAIGTYKHGYPFLCSIFDDAVTAQDDKDLLDEKKEIDALRLIHHKIELYEDKSGKKKPVMGKDVIQMYHDSIKNRLPKQGEGTTKVATTPFELTSVDFTGTQKTEANLFAEPDKKIWDSGGISSLLFSGQSTTGTSQSNAIITDEMLVWPLITMIQNYINNEISKTGWEVQILDTTWFNKKDRVNMAREGLANGGSRTLYMSTMGQEPYDYINLCTMEQEMNIDKIFVPALNSHTLTADSDIGNGAPIKDDSEISDSTEKTRDNQ